MRSCFSSSFSVPRSAILVLLFFTAMARAQISKGHRLLIDNGFQIQGMVEKNDVFTLATYRAANYTTVNWFWESNPAALGAAPGLPWGRWVGNIEQMPPVGAEAPYMSNLVSLSMGDEHNLNDDKVRQKSIDWFNAVRDRYPKTILYVNNFGGQVADVPFQDFLTRGKPDLISFDYYPWRDDFETRKPAPPAGGSPTAFYNSLKFYRAYAMAHGIPFGSYRQSFHAVQDYDRTAYRDPSQSEFRLNTFAALAFGAKMLCDFTYNTGASSFFKSPGGDSHPTPLYRDLVIVNKQVRHLGEALVRLKPVADVRTSDGKPTNDSRVTGVCFIRGQHMENGEAVFNALPTDFHPDSQAAGGGYSDWEFGRNDPYLAGWTVKNDGTKNAGLRGDVIFSWFKVLDEGFDGEKFTDEVYLMVTNGLCAHNGSAIECRQTITLDFGSAKTSYPADAIERLNPETGKVDRLPLAPINSKRRLTLTLDGGMAELLKFSTGAPFVGVDGR